MGIFGSVLDIAAPVVGGALGGLTSGSTEAQASREQWLAQAHRQQLLAQQMMGRDLALYQAQLSAGLANDPYASLRGAVMAGSMSVISAPLDPLADLCPVLVEPDPIILPDPWYRRWWIAFLRWVLRRLS